MILEIVAGAALAATFVMAARRLRAEMRIYAIGLVIAAVIYLGFALAGSAEPRWIAIEFAGILLFASFAWLGLRRSTWWLAVGWAAHPVWDLVLHWVRGTPTFVPAWYPTVCLGFDVLVAARIVLYARAFRATAVKGISVVP